MLIPGSLRSCPPGVHHGGVQDLLQAWATLLARHSTDRDADGVGARLLASWSEPHRRYHSIGHLRDILEHVEELAGYADDADAVRLAAWFHDSVYAGRPDDEFCFVVHGTMADPRWLDPTVDPNDRAPGT